LGRFGKGAEPVVRAVVKISSLNSDRARRRRHCLRSWPGPCIAINGAQVLHH
jgi:hypothetical protein